MLDHLNPEQKSAVLHKDGPSVVFAGAGSGKTRVITTRVIHLIEQGTPAQSILAVTFTNKAAKEMRERMLHLSRDAYRVHVGTFHSSCARWLREFATELGFSSDFTIYDDKDSIQAIKAVLKEFTQEIEDHTPKDYLNFIAKAKTYACLPFEVESTLSHEAHAFPPHAVKVYEKYQNYLANCNAMDFSDLLMNMLILLKNNKLIRQTLQNRFKYILIDEYQDTNLTQFNLINLLVNEKQNLFVVGDDDQSIYSWRGANPHNIIDFKKHYPSAKIYHLEQNYRSSGNIVSAASAMIQKNKNRAPKTLWTDKEPGEILQYKNEYDSETEAWFVADSIAEEKSQFSYNNVAILYRTNAQSRQIEDVLRKQKIPYRIYGSLRFYDRVEIKDLLSYCRLIANADDDIAFRRSLNMPPRGIGKKTVEAVEEIARKNDLSLYLSAQKLTQESKSKASLKILSFLNIIEDLKTFVYNNPLEDFLVYLLEKSNYRPHLEKKYPELLQDKIANIHELGSALSDFAQENKGAKLIDWLKEVALVDNERSENSFAEEEENEAVQLMTLHATKGLEFLKVYILGVEDGLIPHTNSMDNPKELEEERRLLYVGITRAQKKLYLMTAERRRVLNNWVSFHPSRFLKEIPSKFFGIEDEAENIDPTVSKHVKVGSKVYHQTYKSGIVKNIQKNYNSFQALVSFDSFGLRKVDLNKIENLPIKNLKEDLSYDYEI